MTQSATFENQRVIYSHRDGRIVTVLNSEDRCIWTGETLADICSREDPARLFEILTMEQANELSHHHARERLCKGPKSVTAEQFEEMLNILPPVNWAGGGGSESFMVSELITHNLATYYIRLGSAHFSLVEETGKTHQQLVAMCSDFYHPSDLDFRGRNYYSTPEHSETTGG